MHGHAATARRLAFIAPPVATATKRWLQSAWCWRHPPGPDSPESHPSGRRLVAVHHNGTNAAGGRPVGFRCLVCGYLVPADKRRPGVAPTCAGSKVRTGRQHEPAQMQPL
jgi:hypothetical protein